MIAFNGKHVVQKKEKSARRERTCWCSYVFVEDALNQLVSHTRKLIYTRHAFVCFAIEKRIVCATFYDSLWRKCEKCGAGMENSHGNRAFPSMILEANARHSPQRQWQVLLRLPWKTWVPGLQWCKLTKQHLMQLNQVLWLVGVVVSRHDSLLRERENLKFKKGSEKMQVFDDVTSSGDWKALSIVVLSY